MVFACNTFFFCLFLLCFILSLLLLFSLYCVFVFVCLFVFLSYYYQESTRGVARHSNLGFVREEHLLRFELFSSIFLIFFLILMLCVRGGSPTRKGLGYATGNDHVEFSHEWRGLLGHFKNVLRGNTRRACPPLFSKLQQSLLFTIAA